MEKELDYPNNQINYEINDFFYISELYENDENINSENVDNLIESFSDFNSFSEDIFNEEPIPAKIEYIYENNYNLDLDENIIDELYNQINGNLESLNIIIKKKNKKHHNHHHCHIKKNNKEIEKRKKNINNSNKIYNKIQNEIVKKTEDYLNFKRNRKFI